MLWTNCIFSIMSRYKTFYRNQYTNIFFGTFFEYWRKQFLDNAMSSLWNFPSECSNRGNSIFWLTLLRIQNCLHQMLFFSLIRELMKRWLTFKMKELYNFTFIGNLWISFIIICQLDCFHISSREMFISL